MKITHAAVGENTTTPAPSPFPATRYDRQDALLRQATAAMAWFIGYMEGKGEQVPAWIGNIRHDLTKRETP